MAKIKAREVTFKAGGVRQYATDTYYRKAMRMNGEVASETETSVDSYTVTRDGTALFRATEDECYFWLHDHTSSSSYHNLKYEGYKIEKDYGENTGRIYARIVDGEIVQTARTKLLGTGSFAFETSLLGKGYELNMNMPLFKTERAARTWIEKLDGWSIL